MAHFIDTATNTIIDNVLVDSRPRFAEFTADGSQVWVSAEIGGTVTVIGPRHQDANQPVGIRITKDGKRAFVALGPANRIVVLLTALITFEIVRAGNKQASAMRSHTSARCIGLC